MDTAIFSFHNIQKQDCILSRFQMQFLYYMYTFFPKTEPNFKRTFLSDAFGLLFP